jgi:hypothetical protein
MNIAWGKSTGVPRCSGSSGVGRHRYRGGGAVGESPRGFDVDAGEACGKALIGGGKTDVEIKFPEQPRSRSTANCSPSTAVSRAA